LYFSVTRLFRKEEENIEEIRKQERRVNLFKKDMVDEFYRYKLRRDEKLEHFQVKDSMPKCKLIIILLLFLK
jgi:hypothetical protein